MIETIGGAWIAGIGAIGFLVKRLVPQMRSIAKEKLGEDWEKKTWVKFVFDGPMMGAGVLIWIPDTAYMFIFKLIFLFCLFVGWEILNKRRNVEDTPTMKF